METAPLLLANLMTNGTVKNDIAKAKAKMIITKKGSPRKNNVNPPVILYSSYLPDMQHLCYRSILNKQTYKTHLMPNKEPIFPKRSLSEKS